MRRIRTLITTLAMLLTAGLPVQSYSIEFTDSAAPRQIKWPAKTIVVALSTSLGSPGANIKPGSDVMEVVRRALSRWSTVANLTFVEVSSAATSISPGSGGDGVSLITVADTPENNSLFASGGLAGRTRIFYDKVTGAIAEADVVINPHPTTVNGTVMQFSTDGTPGTYDLESTFTHELGHLLGLEHSGVVAATMQARQGINGVYRSPAITERTLSDADRAAVRNLYGPHERSGSIEGKLLNNSLGSDSIPLPVAHIWVESIATGRVIASKVTDSRGSYRIEDIPPGQYRVLAEFANGLSFEPESSVLDWTDIPFIPERALRSAEISSQSLVGANATTTVNFVLLPLQNSSPILKPRLIGTNGELSTIPLPAEAGKRLTVYVGGEGVDQVPASGISVMSPYLTVDSNSLARQHFGTGFPVISFDIAVAPNGLFGDYTIRLQSNSGEVAYVPGAITVDPGVESSFPNPVDDQRFFISQHYRDFLRREADPSGLEYWVSKLAQCESDSECIRKRRIDVSAAFFIEPEFQATGSFVYRIYKAALGRRPTFSEFDSDRSLIVGSGSHLESGRQEFAYALVQRYEFLRKYPAKLTADEFVDRLILVVGSDSGVDLSPERANLGALYDGSAGGRVEIISRIADHRLFAKAEYSRAFVLMQYFSYLRRDPDEAGYNFWLGILNSRLTVDPTAHRSMVCAFFNSAEYQARFSMLVTHSDKECTP